MDVVVAVHGREVKTALFLALNSIPNIEIVATATSTAELISYCHAFHPGAVIVESDLPGRPLPDVLRELNQSTTPERVLIVDSAEEPENLDGIPGVETLRDLDDLLAILSTTDPEEGTQ
jgi:DNA-binding NarL/FixJ family response regulator